MSRMSSASSSTVSGAAGSTLSAEDQQRVSDFIEMEQNRAQIQQAMNRLTDKCWDKCLSNESLGSSGLSSSQESCVANCAERFLDTSIFLMRRMMSKPQ